MKIYTVSEGCRLAVIKEPNLTHQQAADQFAAARYLEKYKEQLDEDTLVELVSREDETDRSEYNVIQAGVTLDTFVMYCSTPKTSN